VAFNYSTLVLFTETFVKNIRPWARVGRRLKKAFLKNMTGSEERKAFSREMEGGGFG
jgi:hypothetical protein